MGTLNMTSPTRSMSTRHNLRYENIRGGDVLRRPLLINDVSESEVSGAIFKLGRAEDKPDEQECQMDLTAGYLLLGTVQKGLGKGHSTNLVLRLMLYNCIVDATTSSLHQHMLPSLPLPMKQLSSSSLHVPQASIVFRNSARFF